MKKNIVTFVLIMKKYKKIILHIPHSSTFIPKKCEKKYLDSIEVKDSINCLTDWYTNKLFDFSNDTKIFDAVIFPYSRIYCDVERYFDNSKEFMYNRGMGYLYTNGVNLKPIRDIQKINVAKINVIYWKYHVQLYGKLIDLNNKNITPLLIDCHSFSDEVYECDKDFKQDVLPDICLGYNKGDENSLETLNIIYNKLIEKGYSVEINYPYNGSLTVNETTHDSIMIEINKRLYLSEHFRIKRIEFNKLKKDLHNILLELV